MLDGKIKVHIAVFKMKKKVRFSRKITYYPYLTNKKINIHHNPQALFYYKLKSILKKNNTRRKANASCFINTTCSAYKPLVTKCQSLRTAFKSYKMECYTTARIV